MPGTDSAAIRMRVQFGDAVLRRVVHERPNETGRLRIASESPPNRLRVAFESNASVGWTGHGIRPTGRQTGPAAGSLGVRRDGVRATGRFTGHEVSSSGLGLLAELPITYASVLSQEG